jgi:hypothetical protein
MQAMNDLVYVLRSCQYLPLADRLEGGRKTSLWLAGNRDVARLLYRAIQDANGPEECLGKFQSLLAADEKKVRAYANLSVAFATTRAMEHYIRQPRAASMLESFAYYTDANNSFRCDLKALPYEFLRFLADTRLGLWEREWAQRRFARSPDLTKTYFQVRYDEDYYYRGRPKRLSRAEYTLANILRLGGICIDQAYFASETNKAMGVPAAIVHGHSLEGGPHAWLAYLKVPKKGEGLKAEWDAQTARYVQHKYYTGTLTDPASGETIHDSELALMGSAALLSLDRREQADAATALAAMAAGAVKAPPSELGPRARVEPAMVEKLLFEAVNRNLAHRRAWELVIRLRRGGELSTACMDRLFDFLLNRTANDFPDYGCTLIVQIVPTYEPARREKIYRGAIEMYAHRPDLQAQVLIALGDDYAAQGRKDQALGAYQEVLTSQMREMTEALVTASRRAGDLLVADRRRDQAIALYQRLFSEAKEPDRDGAYYQTAYYQLGKRLAELLQDDSQADAAKQVLQKIGDAGPPEKT